MIFGQRQGAWLTTGKRLDYCERYRVYSDPIANDDPRRALYDVCSGRRQTRLCRQRSRHWLVVRNDKGNQKKNKSVVFVTPMPEEILHEILRPVAVIGSHIFSQRKLWSESGCTSTPDTSEGCSNHCVQFYKSKSWGLVTRNFAVILSQKMKTIRRRQTMEPIPSKLSRRFASLESFEVLWIMHWWIMHHDWHGHLLLPLLLIDFDGRVKLVNRWRSNLFLNLPFPTDQAQE